MQIMTPEEMQVEAERSERTDCGKFAMMLIEAMVGDPTGLLDGKIIAYYNTITSTGFVIESAYDGERYDVLVTKK